MSQTLEEAEAAYKKANAAYKLDNCGENYRAREAATVTLLHERRRVLRIDLARKACEDAELVAVVSSPVFAAIVAAFLADDLREYVAPSRLEDTDPAND